MSDLNIPFNIIDHEFLKEYVVNCVSMEELESLYDDLETEGGSDYIPDRIVEVAKRRPTSKNTHYMLSSDEAKLLRNDPRVNSVQAADFIKSSIKMATSQTATFSKVPPANSITESYKNWALLRCLEGKKRSGWGDDTGTQTQTDTIQRLYTGKNVDIIIVDGITSVPDHPEFAIDLDASGGTRCLQFDWYYLNNIVGNYPSTGVSYYNYNDSSDPNSEAYKNHGTHVAGIVAGNTNGWARDATIYNISPYGFGGIDPLLIWDYIRAFHANKPINPTTGRKNPTICNCSYENSFTSQQLLSYGFGKPLFGVFRDVGIGHTTTVDGLPQIAGIELTEDELNRMGIITETGTTNFKFPYYDEAIVSDITQAINDGIVIVGAAGNESFFVDSPSGVDYNNQLYFGVKDEFDNVILTASLYYHKGSAPSAVHGVINVGAISADSTEKISSYTNKGPGIDVFAPGDWIISSVATSAGSHDISNQNTGALVYDSRRNGTYLLGRDYGTSMASAQVTGMVACLMEAYPSMTANTALNFMKANATYYQIPQDVDDIYYISSPVSNTAPSYFSTRIMHKNYLLGAPNRYARLKKLRATSGDIYPPQDFLLRPSSGILYPRSNLRIVT